MSRIDARDIGAMASSPRSRPPNGAAAARDGKSLVTRDWQGRQLRWPASSFVMRE